MKTVGRIIKENPQIRFVGFSKAGHWEIAEKKQDKEENDS